MDSERAARSITTRTTSCGCLWPWKPPQHTDSKEQTTQTRKAWCKPKRHPANISPFLGESPSAQKTGWWSWVLWLPQGRNPQEYNTCEVLEPPQLPSRSNDGQVPELPSKDVSHSLPSQLLCVRPESRPWMSPGITCRLLMQEPPACLSAHSLPPPTHSLWPRCLLPTEDTSWEQCSDVNLSKTSRVSSSV